MKENKEGEEKSSNEETIPQNKEKTIEKKEENLHKERKKPNIYIPIFEINIKYYQMKLDKKNKNKKKENINNIINIFPQQRNPIM